MTFPCNPRIIAAMSGLSLRDADRVTDADAIWAILEPVFRRGETYGVDVDISRGAALAYWFEHRRIRVAVVRGRVVGTYWLDRNHGGNASHVANCAYAVESESRGGGIGRAMCVDSLDRAREAGFTAMQFNLVVSTNEGAVHLWRSMGFEVVGVVPEGFRHPDLGYVDAFVMHRRL